jgi:hypothetical protein
LGFVIKLLTNPKINTFTNEVKNSAKEAKNGLKEAKNGLKEAKMV